MESGLVDHWKFMYQQAMHGKTESEKYYADRLAKALRRVEELEKVLRDISEMDSHAWAYRRWAKEALAGKGKQ